MLCAAIVAAVLQRAWWATRLREAYLPELEAMAQRHRHDGRLLALLGARQLQAKQFAPAAHTLQQAAGARENSESVGICLAAARAAVGDPTATDYLKLGAGSDASPDMEAVMARVRALPQRSSAAVVAATIAPQGAAPLIDAYGQGSFLNGLVEWWGRRHPEQSGFSTRQAWAQGQPEDAEAQRWWGLALLRNERRRDAAEPLERAVQLSPQSALAHFALATLLETQSPASASLEYIACLKLRPRWVPALLGLGRATMASGLPMTAAEVYGVATQVSPASVEAWIGLGEADVAAKHNLDAALRAFDTAARLAPVRTDYLTSYAFALRQNGRWTEAEAAARRSVAAVPDQARGHYVLAGILTDYNPTTARLAEAMAQARLALRLTPDSSAIQLLLAGLLLRHGEAPEAILRLRPIVATQPLNVNARFMLARAYRRVGLGALAQQVSSRAVAVYQDKDQIDLVNARLEENPSDSATHLELARLYADAGQVAKAQQERQLAARFRRATGDGSVRTLPELIQEVLHQS